MGLTVSGFDSSSISTLFSSLNNTGNTNSSLNAMAGLVGEYKSIQSGSYFKLLRSYYTPKAGDTSATTDTTDKNLTDKNLSEWKADATELTDAANVLLNKGKDSVFSKVETKKEDGKTTYEYDTDKIYSAVSKFVSAYNDMVSSGRGADVSGVSSAVAGMESLTMASGKMLAQIGIQMDVNGKLQVNEAEFKKSDMTIVKSLFQDTGSYGYQVSAKASMVRSAVFSQAAGGSYDRTGAISMKDLMSTYNSYI